jgi:hypothetical protein
MHPGEDKIDHTIYVVSIKLSYFERNFTTTKHEGLEMFYSLYMFRHYLLDTPFIFFTNNSLLKYFVNKAVLEGRICRWFLLFQELEFEVMVKFSRHNVGPNNILRIELRGFGGSLDDELPDTLLFRIEAVLDQLVKLASYLTTSIVL